MITKFATVKKIIIIFSLLIVLKPVIPVLQYAANYDYIATVLCVNKAKPEMHCNGKCHLMKELAKASENEKPSSSEKKSSNVEVNLLFAHEIPDYNCIVFRNDSSIKTPLSRENLYAPADLFSIFHPPIFIS